MAADIKIRLIADDSDVTNNSATPTALSPYMLWRGMTSTEEYHIKYAKNEGDAVLTSPTHTLSIASGADGNSNEYYRKVTGSAKDETGDTITGATGPDPKLSNLESTIYIAYSGAQPWWSFAALGPTAIPDLSSQMKIGRCYDLWSKYKCSYIYTAMGVTSFRHGIGGS